MRRPVGNKLVTGSILLGVITAFGLALILVSSADAATPKPAWPATNTCAPASDIAMRCNLARPVSFKVKVKPLTYVSRGKWLRAQGHAFVVAITANCDHRSKSVVLHPTRKFTFTSKYLRGFSAFLSRSRRCHIEVVAHPSLTGAGRVDWVSVVLSGRYRP